MKKKNLFQKMDDIPGDYPLYERVFNDSSNLVVFLLGLYLLLCSCGLDIGATIVALFVSLIRLFVPLPDTIIPMILEVVLECWGFIWSFDLIYKLKLRNKQRKWVEENPKLILQGQWLHIHEKENIRIGIVDIQQHFSSLKVEGFNIDPLAPGLAITGRTTWSYIDSEIEPKSLAGVKFSGSYAARKADGTTNQGVHNFTSISYDPNNHGRPKFMSGYFCDCLRIGSTADDPESTTMTVNLNDRSGKIFFYRISPKMKQFLEQNDLDDYNLQHILSLVNKTEYAYIANEEFVGKLKDIVAHRTAQ